MKKIAFIGQAPPLKVVELPFGKSALYKWLESEGFKYEKQKDFELSHNQEGILSLNGQPVAEVKFGALISYFPGSNKNGGHLAPSQQEIVKERPSLISMLKAFAPDIVVPIGKLSIGECLDEQNIKLEDFIGKSFIANPYEALTKEIKIIPFPHPSGASTWIYQKGNSDLLKKALALLKDEVKH